MDVKVENEPSPPTLQDQLRPLLENVLMPRDQQKTPGQKAIRKTFKGTAHLANLLPTGTVLTFQLLSPILTNQGQCPTPMNQLTTLVLLALCGVLCFLLSFTDSFRDERGKVRYGLATFSGLWVIDGSVTLSPEEAAGYRVRFIDFLHALLSILVFAAVALFDQNVVKCFEPMPSDKTKDLLLKVPIGIGLVCSVLFVLFPTKRHGIGFPLSRR
ncbi:hypothetical protein L1049_024197 [Liquidambar formosana]|uniref:Uncharacterized protein n=1 Tax=Liquidambar formosana TaxID=63359 RepID=A0AAP0RUH1_LIQFO